MHHVLPRPLLRGLLARLPDWLIPKKQWGCVVKVRGCFCLCVPARGLACMPSKIQRSCSAAQQSRPASACLTVPRLVCAGVSRGGGAAGADGPRRLPGEREGTTRADPSCAVHSTARKPLHCSQPLIHISFECHVMLQSNRHSTTDPIQSSGLPTLYCMLPLPLPRRCPAWRAPPSTAASCGWATCRATT